MSTATPIDRTNWNRHPHFATQALLLGSHASFRRISQHLIEVSDQDVAEVEWLYPQWISAMRSHEAYEETKLYPFLALRFGASFEEAEAGHAALHRCDDDVRTAIAAGVESKDRKGLRQTLENHDKTLREHLMIEEDLAIPLLLDLSPSEFNDYYRLPISELARNFQENDHGQTD